MRCQDATREISSPTGGVDQADLNRHLASCPRCAAWAKRSAQLDRLWAQTQPVEPAAAFDQAWASVSRRLGEAAGHPAVRPAAFASRRRWALAMAVPVAAAAAVFIAMAIMLHHGDSEPAQIATQTHAQPPQPTPEPAPLVAHHVDVDAGLPVLIHMKNQEVDVELLRRMSAGEKNMVAADFDMFNTLESLAQQ